MRLVNRHKSRVKELYKELMLFNFKKRTPKECMEEAKRISHKINQHMGAYRDNS